MCLAAVHILSLAKWEAVIIAVRCVSLCGWGWLERARVGEGSAALPVLGPVKVAPPSYGSRAPRRDEDEDGADRPFADGDAANKSSRAGGSQAKPQEDDDPSAENIVCKLGKLKYVSVREYMGRTLVDIREYYVEHGEMRPGRKGISLTVEQWMQLRNHVDDIDKAVKQIESQF
eukprot:jgi/Mesvir1/501/Mv11369-RA.1